MSTRLTSLEKLARRICWAEFGGMSTKKLGTTETKYWSGLPEQTKRQFCEEAGRICWATDAVTGSRGGLKIWARARLDQHRVRVARKASQQAAA